MEFRNVWEKGGRLILGDALIAIFTSASFSLALPPLDVFPLPWVFLVPYLVAIRRRGFRRAFRLALLTGAAFSVTILFHVVDYHWLIYSFGIGTVTACFLLSTCCIKVIEARLPSSFRLLLFPSIWTSLEWVVHQTPINIPLSLGVTQVPQSTVLQVASVTGVYGISFLLMLSNSTVAYLTDFVRPGRVSTWTGAGIFLRPVWNPVLLPILVSISLVLLGMLSFSMVNSSVGSEELTVAIIQGNIQKWMSDALEGHLALGTLTQETYLSLSKKAINLKSPDLIVWPETAIRRNVMRLPETRDQLYSLLQSGSYFVFGSPDIDEYGYAYNSAFVVAPTGKVLGRHDKVNLAPNETDFDQAEPGSMRTIETPLGRFAIVICFESALPHLAQALSKKGASLLFILTNDAVLKQPTGPYIHANEAILRAVENRVHVIQAANTGVSQLVDPYGRVLAKSSLDTTEIVFAKVSPSPAASFYSKYGDLFSFACLSMSILSFMFTLYRSRSRVPETGEMAGRDQKG